MDPDPIISISFAFFLLLSGILGTIRTLFSFFRRYQERISDEEIQEIIPQIIDAWKREGYIETVSFGQLALDSVSLVLGIRVFENFFTWASPQYFSSSPKILFILSMVTSVLFIYVISRQLIPTIGQANLVRVTRWVFLLFSIYWLMTSWFGKMIFAMKKFLLKKSGFQKKYKIFNEKDIQNFDSDDNGLEEDEAEMVQNVINIGSTLVKEIFTPRVDCVAINVNSTYEEVIEILKKDKFTRIPVYDVNIDNILGILHVKDLLFIKNEGTIFNLKDHIRSAYFIPRSKKVDDLMAEFQQDRSHIAIVVDEYGGTAGIITLEDILEEIVGEIQDEDDIESPKIAKITGNTFEIDPIITLDDINKELDIHIKPKEEVEIDTLGGYLQYLKGSVPREGDSISQNGYSFEILKMQGQSIERVRLVISDLPA